MKIFILLMSIATITLTVILRGDPQLNNKPVEAPKVQIKADFEYGANDEIPIFK